MRAHPAGAGRIGWARLLAAVFALLGAYLLYRTFAETGDGGELSPLSVAVAATWFVGGGTLVLLTRGTGPSGDEPVPALVGGATARSVTVAARTRPLVASAAVGLAFAVICVIGALVLYRIPFFEPWVQSAVSTASNSTVIVFVVALVTGLAEEVYFRIGLKTVFAPGWWYVIGSTIVYMACTAATGNAALVLAAGMLGVVASETYRCTGRWYTPLIIHGFWTAGVVGLFPHLI